MKKLFFVLLAVLVAGCTTQAVQNSTNIEVEQRFQLNASNIATTYAEIPFVSSAVPGPESRDMLVNNMIKLFFNENLAYENYEFSLHERYTWIDMPLDTTTFDPFISTDLGLKPLLNGKLTALKPNMQYVLEIEGLGSAYYYQFTTTNADTINPRVEGAYFEGNDLVILFSERVDSSYVNAVTIDVEKDGVDRLGNFNTVRTIANQMYEDKKYYVTYDGLTSGEYRVSISGVKDTTGNTMTEIYTELLTKS